jgi:hypothetical protein
MKKRVPFLLNAFPRRILSSDLSSTCGKRKEWEKRKCGIMFLLIEACSLLAVLGLKLAAVGLAFRWMAKY